MHNAIPIPFALVCVLSITLFSWLHSSRMCSPEECGCCSGTAMLLPCYRYQSYCYRCFAATTTRYHHVAIRGQQAQTSSEFPASLDPLDSLLLCTCFRVHETICDGI
ncbi:hypothetical protein ACS0PU_009190 [Formica fusca]